MSFKHVSFCCAHLLLVTGYLSAQEMVYLFEDDVITVEAEDLVHGSDWVFESTQQGYTGRGYLRYNGPERLGDPYSKMDEEKHLDMNGSAQGDPSQWIRIPVKVTTTGAYHLNIRAFHRIAMGHWAHTFGGDQSCWIHLVGHPLPVTMGHVNPNRTNSFAWLGFGPGSNEADAFEAFSFALTPGVYTFYISGRHRDFIADRISIYRKIGRDLFPPNSTSATIAPSEPVSLESVQVHRNALPALHQGISLPNAHRYDIRGRAVTTAHSTSHRTAAPQVLISGGRASLQR